MSERIPRNRVWVDGVELDIQSGDVIAFQKEVGRHLANGGGSLVFPTAYGRYEINVTLSTSIIYFWTE